MVKIRDKASDFTLPSQMGGNINAHSSLERRAVSFTAFTRMNPEGAPKRRVFLETVMRSSMG